MKPRQTVVNDERLDQIFHDLLAAECPCEMSAVLTALPDIELKAAYEDFLTQYGQELALGALEQSDWLCGNLIINANQPSICFTQSGLDAMRAEIERRNAAEGDDSGQKCDESHSAAVKGHEKG